MYCYYCAIIWIKNYGLLIWSGLIVPFIVPFIPGMAIVGYDTLCGLGLGCAKAVIGARVGSLCFCFFGLIVTPGLLLIKFS